MSRKEIIERLQKELNISKDKAITLFEEALKKGEIRQLWNWKKIIDSIVIVLLLTATSYCLIKIILSYLDL
jgi:hypothetical protein